MFLVNRKDTAAIPLQQTEIINSQVTSKMVKKGVSTVVGYHSKV